MFVSSGRGMGRKKQRLHLDRGDVLDALGKKPNISTAVETGLVSSKMGSYERHFTHKLFVSDDDYLDAYILRNDICVLFTKKNINASSFLFHVALEVMSGRRKKGARKIKADTVICEITTTEGQVLALKTPVGGQLLELNEGLAANLQLLENIHSGERYIAVIFPDTKIPSPGQSVDEWKAVQASMAFRSNVCYSWLQGKCLRGEKCRFVHSDDIDTPNSALNPSTECQVGDGSIEMAQEQKEVEAMSSELN
jgi:glycine cleavage system H lipoate-binding protein